MFFFKFKFRLLIAIEYKKKFKNNFLIKFHYMIR